MSSEESIASSRVTDRDSLFLMADVSATGARAPISVRVRNLSPGGMMIDGNPAFSQGVTVVTELRGIGEVKGHVAWAIPERAGVAFDVEIDPKMARYTVASRDNLTLARPQVETSRRPGLKLRG